MKNLPLKMLRSFIYPAGFMVLGKIVGMIFITNLNNYPFSLKNNLSETFSIQFTYASVEQVQMVATISNLFMIIFVLAGCLFWLIKALFFHDSHESPRVIVKLSELNMISFISDTYSIYVPLFAWVLYVWLCVGLIGVDTYLDKSNLWLLIFSLIIGIVITGLSFYDVQREFQIKNKLYVHEYE